MFSQLIEIKKRREGRLRQQLADETQQHLVRLKNLEIMIAQRQQLQQEWRKTGREGQGNLTSQALSRLRQRLAGFHREDETMKAACSELEAAIRTWPDSRRLLETQIRRATTEQEKLKYLAENTF